MLAKRLKRHKNPTIIIKKLNNEWNLRNSSSSWKPSSKILFENIDKQVDKLFTTSSWISSTYTFSSQIMKMFFLIVHVTWYHILGQERKK